MSEDQHQSDEATTNDDGNLPVDLEDAGGKELRDVTEKPPEGEVKEMEEERERRLDPDNRPEGAEVDNTHREFDSSTGHFTDSDEHDQGEDTPYAPEAGPENVSDADADAGDEAAPNDEAESADDDTTDEQVRPEHRA